MGFGTINVGATPCCGRIVRTWGCFPNESSPTGWEHSPGDGENGEYAPSFNAELGLLARGICPDCGTNLAVKDPEETKDIQAAQSWFADHACRDAYGYWHWNYTDAEDFYVAQEAQRMAATSEQLNALVLAVLDQREN